MTVIPLRPRRGSAVERTTDRSSPETPIRASFRSPTGRAGTMTGSIRVERFIRGLDQAWAECVFSGTLVDADGSRIGTSSRRQSTPAVLGDDDTAQPATIGPVDVDLLGLAVTIPALTVVRCAKGGRPGRSGYRSRLAVVRESEGGRS